MRQLAVIILHGIGNQTSSYADMFIAKVQKEFQKVSGLSYDRLVFESVCWQDEMLPMEGVVYDNMKTLGWKRLRKLFVSYAGDALAYQPSPALENDLFRAVHKKLDDALVRLRSKVAKDTPLCVISHSLGTIVASNYLWDCQNLKSPGRKFYKPTKEACEMVKNLELLYTMGSPLAVWSMRFKDGGSPIKVPSSGRWVNVFNKNDIISSPIKTINQHYKEMDNLEDLSINVGNLLTRWNPASHVAYWTDSRVINHIAENLKYTIS
jgi:hypothetical protein